MLPGPVTSLQGTCQWRVITLANPIGHDYTLPRAAGTSWYESRNQFYRRQRVLTHTYDAFKIAFDYCFPGSVTHNARSSLALILLRDHPRSPARLILSSSAQQRASIRCLKQLRSIISDQLLGSLHFSFSILPIARDDRSRYKSSKGCHTDS